MAKGRVFLKRRVFALVFFTKNRANPGCGMPEDEIRYAFRALWRHFPSGARFREKRKEVQKRPQGHFRRCPVTRKILLLAVLAITALAVPTARADLYDFNDLAPPGGSAIMNSFAPNYMGLTFGNAVAAIDAAAAGNITWTGIQGGAGLFLVSGEFSFVINFPQPVGIADFLVSSPDGSQQINANGTLFNIEGSPIMLHLSMNAASLNIGATKRFTFDNLSTSASQVPLPGSFLLLLGGLGSMILRSHYL